MHCPACGKDLAVVTVENLTVEVCENGCGGIYFDIQEIDRVDEPHEAAGESLLGILGDPAVTVDYEMRRTCPKCPDQIMLRHFRSVRHEIEVDECPTCGGIFLDMGELAKIRGQFKNAAEKKKAATAHFEALFAKDIQAMLEESEQKLESARKIRRAVRKLIGLK